MYNIGDYVVYLKDVCKILDIKKKYMNDTDYYILSPVNDNSLKLNIPVNNHSIRNLITIEKINEIINNILNIKTIECDDKNIEKKYKKLLNNASWEDLITIIKTTYKRNQARLDNKKKISDKDKNYFELAEIYLYTEFSIVLNMSFEETKEYIIKKVEEGVVNE